VYFERSPSWRIRIEPVVTGGILRNMTTKWLRDNEITFDNLIIERGNTDTQDCDRKHQPLVWEKRSGDGGKASAPRYQSSTTRRDFGIVGKVLPLLRQSAF
jgi:hypothetical protein